MNDTNTQPTAITFQDFIASREAVDDIFKAVQCSDLKGQKGYVYLRDGKDGYYIQLTDEGKHWTIAIQDEILTASLIEAEHFLWNELVFFEVCADLNRIPAFDDSNPTPESCNEWIKKLHEAGLLYHFDDEPCSIIHDGGVRTFSLPEIETLIKIMWAMHRIEGYDPFETCVALTK